MISNTCSIYFYCRQGQATKKGEAKIEMSLNYCGNRFFITLPRREIPKIFNQRINSKKDNDIKDYCNYTKERVKEHIFELIKSNKPITKENIKSYIHNGFKDYLTLEFVINEYLNIKFHDNSISKASKYSNKLVMEKLLNYCGKDTDIKTITESEISKFIADKLSDYKANTFKVYIVYLKALFAHAVRNNYISKNPIENYKTKREKTKILNYLNDTELNILQTTNCGKYETAKDCFLFQVYTGLAFIDYYNLKNNQIQKGNKGYYIKGFRTKTGIEYTIPLTNDALNILDKYNFELPKIEFQKYNRQLQNIKRICGIEKQMTSHTARHTTATTYLLKNGIDKIAVQKILGHASIKQTEEYAITLDESVINEMSEFEAKREERIKHDTEIRQKFEDKERLKNILKRVYELAVNNKEYNLTEEEIEDLIEQQSNEEIFNGKLEIDLLEDKLTKGEISYLEYKKQLAEISNRTK